MFIYSKFQNHCSLVRMLAVMTLGGCAVHLPPVPTPNPADPGAPEAATASLRPTLLASSRIFPSPAAEPRKNAAVSQSATAAIYTCPMHPEVQETKPGNCPICGMTLVKKLLTPEGAKP
jgi:Heavy metal binding domain